MARNKKGWGVVEWVVVSNAVVFLLLCAMCCGGGWGDTRVNPDQPWMEAIDDTLRDWFGLPTKEEAKKELEEKWRNRREKF